MNWRKMPDYGARERVLQILERLVPEYRRSTLGPERRLPRRGG